tara:strand:- start:117 stop:308 length:192 start_codon:yes stop_codon:yes gene_type:complete
MNKENYNKRYTEIYQSKGMIKSVSMEDINDRPAIVVTLQFDDYLQAEDYWSVLKDMQKKLENK